jgi:hypothetical protein
MRRTDGQAAASEADASADAPVDMGASSPPMPSASVSSNSTARPHRHPKEDMSSTDAKISGHLFTMRFNSELNHAALGSFKCELCPNGVYSLALVWAVAKMAKMAKAEASASSPSAPSLPATSSSSSSSHEKMASAEAATVFLMMMEKNLTGKCLGTVMQLAGQILL